MDSSDYKRAQRIKSGRRIQLKNENLEHANEAFTEDLEFNSGVFRVRGVTINYKKESGAYGIQGVSPDYQRIENMSMVTGRYLNQLDMDANLKVVVISKKIKREMMKEVENPLDEYLQLSGINFKIIGVYSDEGGEREENRIYIPMTTAQKYF